MELHLDPERRRLGDEGVRFLHQGDDADSHGDRSWFFDGLCRPPNDVEPANANARKTIWLEAIAILDGAIKLGKQADDVDIGLVVKRMEVAKARELLTAGEKP